MKLAIPHLSAKTLVLASKSPRRQELVRALGLPVVVRESEVDEVYPDNLAVKDIARYLAELKARPLIDSLDESEILLTGDTTVILDEEILNKPDNRDDAERMLRKLSGRSHYVITGVCLVKGSKILTFDDTAEVKFCQLDERLIHCYLESGSPFDKAGAYGAQDDFGKLAIQRLTGSFYTVMGFPIHLIYQALKEL